MKKTTVAFYTQGCRLNQSETAIIEQLFNQEGFSVVEFDSGADIVVVNTCTVTENGDKDTRRLVNRILRLNEASKIALVGCQAQILKEVLLKLPNVMWVVGNTDKMRLASLLAQDLSPKEPMVRVSKIPRETFKVETPGIDNRHVRANIKIQDGCDFYCSFCVIPFARGPARSRDYHDIIKECRSLVAAGHQEIVITGINVGTYSFEKYTLEDVLDGLEDIEGLKRIRISSIEPTTIPLSLVDRMDSSSKLCRYLHIPLQSGSDSVLKRMSRKYSTAEFLEFISSVKRKVNDVCIGTDVIVGFPGETQEEFEETLAFLKEAPIDYFHVFSYSERKFARSKKLAEPVKSHDIAYRSKCLRELSKRKQVTYMSRFIGSEQEVLWESIKKGVWNGLTDHYLRIRSNGDAIVKNQFSKVKLKSISGQALEGVLVS